MPHRVFPRYFPFSRNFFFLFLQKYVFVAEIMPRFQGGGMRGWLGF
jgi:hypothetical protein